MGCEGGVRQECKINELPQQQQRDSQKRGKLTHSKRAIWLTSIVFFSRAVLLLVFLFLLVDFFRANTGLS